MTEVKSVEEIKENIARAFIEEHNLQNMLDENGNRKKYTSKSDRGDDFTYEDEDCKELLEDFEKREGEIATLEEVLEDHCSAKKYPDTGAGKYGEDDEIREGQSMSEIRGSASVTPIESIEEVKKITPIKSIEEVEKIIQAVKHVYPLTDRQAQLLRDEVEKASDKYSRRKKEETKNVKCKLLYHTCLLEVCYIGNTITNINLDNGIIDSHNYASYLGGTIFKNNIEDDMTDTGK